MIWVSSCRVLKFHTLRIIWVKNQAATFAKFENHMELFRDFIELSGKIGAVGGLDFDFGSTRYCRIWIKIK